MYPGTMTGNDTPRRQIERARRQACRLRQHRQAAIGFGTGRGENAVGNLFLKHQRHDGPEIRSRLQPFDEKFG